MEIGCQGSRVVTTTKFYDRRTRGAMQVIEGKRWALKGGKKKKRRRWGGRNGPTSGLPIGRVNYCGDRMKNESMTMASHSVRPRQGIIGELSVETA